MIGNVTRKLAVLITVALLICATPAWSANAGQTDGVFAAFAGMYASGDESSAPDTRPSKPEFETLRGNSTPMGYILSHGNVIVRSESVTVSGSKLFRGVDYFIDYPGGSLTFSRPIRSSESVRITYRYAEGDSGERTVLSVPSLALASSDRLSLNFTYAYRVTGSGENKAPDTATYGFNSITNFGSSSSIKSMLYVSNPQKSNNRFSEMRDSPQRRAAEAKSDDLIVQNADFGFGSTRLQLTYQDVGKNFKGFQALRESRAADDAVVAQLQKETGLKRIGVGLQFGSGKTPAAGVLPTGLLWNSIKGEKGEFQARGVNLNLGKLGFYAQMRGSDAGFSRMNDLSDAEKTALALQIRQQFNADATAQQVTSDDKNQLARGAGLDRSNYGMRFGTGSSTSWIQMSSVGDGNGGVDRKSFRFSGKKFSLFGFSQSINDSFSRLADVTDVEKQQFGNERGMDRTNLGGDFTLGSLQTSLAFSEVSSSEGSVKKRSLAVKGKIFDVRANFQDIDPSFTRIADLADPDKGKMQQEQGYKRMDVSGKFAIGKKLSVDSFLYDAHNATQDMDRRQLRNLVTLRPDKRTKMTLLSDQFSFTSAQGNLDSFSHRNIDIERRSNGGVFLHLVRDTMDKQTGQAEGLATTTQVLHLETDESKKDKTFAVIDRKTIDFGNGKSENTQSVNVQSVLSKALSLKGSYLDIDRGSDPSETTNTYSLQWAGRKGRSLSANLMRKTTNSNQNAEGMSVTLKSPFAGGAMTIDYSASSIEGSDGKMAAAFGFVSNRAEKKWLHFDLFYKTRDDGAGDPFLVRNYNLDARLTQKTKLTYSYNTFKEAQDGKIAPVGAQCIHLTSQVGSGYALVADYKKDRNFAEKKVVAPITLGISGRLNSGAAFELGFGRNLTATTAGSVRGNTYRVKFDHQIDADHFINFSAALTLWDSTNPTVKTDDNLEARVDYKTTFDL